MTDATPTVTLDIPTVDATAQSAITPEQVQFFLDNGFLVVRNVLSGAELVTIQEAMTELINKAPEHQGDPDYLYGKGEQTGEAILRRIEYVIDKHDPMKALMGHSFILRSIELLQGPNFIPTWDSMVIKMPNEGISVPWHRDAAMPDTDEPLKPIFNVDFYLDNSDLKSCVWVIPGSNNWSAEDATARIAEPGFKTDDAIPVPLNAGDVIFHNILVLHGSPAGCGNALRRTVYYEFRPGEIELKYGPHNAEYLHLKQQLLLACIEARKAAPYARNEEPFAYRPTGELAIQSITPPSPYRYRHRDYEF